MVLPMAVETKPDDLERLVVVVVVSLDLGLHLAPFAHLGPTQQPSRDVRVQIATGVGASTLFVGELGVPRPMQPSPRALAAKTPPVPARPRFVFAPGA